jgi:hypothetical protein
MFWRALCAGAVQRSSPAGEDVAGQNVASGAHWLSLVSDDATSPVYWFGQVLLGQHLYVRRSYQHLYDIVKELWRTESWVLLLGSPGND